jgi:heterotetrameric sarcosine oxidase delta subunit
VFLVTCPNCGARNVSEFRYGGASRPRPDVNATTPQAWADYLYARANPLGIAQEWWYHRAGCGCWFVAERHTKTHEVIRTYLWLPQDHTT